MPFAGVALAGAAVVHLAIAAGGGVPGPMSGALLAVAALACALWLLRYRAALARVRFGGLAAHAIMYGAFSATLTLHALIRVLLAARDHDASAAAHLLLGTPWFGVALGMSSLWGIGLLIHAIGVAAGGGWED